MSESNREQAEEHGIDLGTGVDRRLLWAATGLFVVLMASTVAACLLGGTATAPQHEMVGGPPPRDMATLLPVRPQATPAPRSTLPATTPAEPCEGSVAPAGVKAAPRRHVVVAKYVPLPESALHEQEKAEQAPTALPFKRRYTYSEDDLRLKVTSDSRELDIESLIGTTKVLLAKTKDSPSRVGKHAASADKEAPQTKAPLILELVAERPDLKGLPVRDLTECQVPEKVAQAMHEKSRFMREVTSEIDRRRDRQSHIRALDRDKLLADFIKVKLQGKDWGDDVGVRMLVQMLQTEGLAVRLQVVQLLAKAKHKSAGAALARWAVFDLHPDVRQAAVKALKDRLNTEYRPVLLEALRYPWPPVADHAAEAIVALKDRDSATSLAGLMDAPDPRAPFRDKNNRWVRTDLVRVNHLGNCVLCHAPSADENDPIRGLVPERGKPLPEEYYESESGNFVRADLTYLKQDFSVLQAAPKPDKWPSMQRFDYLLRTRELTPDEVARLVPTEERDESNATLYPQRAAVLWALRELTGQNLGVRSEDWYAYLRDVKSAAEK
jgi:hypothetical protein